jgi:hypothetical protein
LQAFEHLFHGSVDPIAGLSRLNPGRTVREVDREEHLGSSPVGGPAAIHDRALAGLADIRVFAIGPAIRVVGRDPGGDWCGSICVHRGTSPRKADP